MCNIAKQCNEQNKIVDNIYKYAKFPKQYIVRVPDTVNVQNIKIIFRPRPTTINQKIIYLLTKKGPDQFEHYVSRKYYREFIYDKYKYLIIPYYECFAFLYFDNIEYLELVY